ncbi:hypothetical protein Tco_0600674 [Tanacetum coccineum]
MSSSSKSTHDYSRKLRRAILEHWRQSYNLPPSPPPNRNTPTSLSTTNSSPSLLPPQNPSPNQITHELHHLSNLLEINLQQAIDAIDPSPLTSPCIPPPSLDQVNLHSEFCHSVRGLVGCAMGWNELVKGSWFVRLKPGYVADLTTGGNWSSFDLGLGRGGIRYLNFVRVGYHVDVT